MATFVVTTASEDEVRRINPDIAPVFESGEFRIYSVRDPVVALRQQAPGVEAFRRDAGGIAEALERFAAENE